jgi:hypothetical protein
MNKGMITNILEENVIQPLLVSTSAIELASECVRMLLKIDDIVSSSFSIDDLLCRFKVDKFYCRINSQSHVTRLCNSIFINLIISSYQKNKNLLYL